MAFEKDILEMNDQALAQRENFSALILQQSKAITGHQLRVITASAPPTVT